MNHKSRMQNRRLRSDGWDPIDHNKTVAIRKRYIRLAARHKKLRANFNAITKSSTNAGLVIQNLSNAIQKIRSDYTYVR